MLANVRPRLLEYVSRAVVTHNSGVVENDADVNFTIAKKVLDKLVSGEWHQINFLEVYP